MLDTLKQSTVEETLLDRVLTIKPTARVERMRNALFGIKPSLTIDWARIDVRVLKETEGEPMITRRAKVFAALAREMPIDIYPDELFVGYPGPGPRWGHVNPMNALSVAEHTQGRVLESRGIEGLSRADQHCLFRHVESGPAGTGEIPRSGGESRRLQRFFYPADPNASGYDHRKDSARSLVKV